MSEEEVSYEVGYPDDNPKTKFGMTKVPLHLCPPSAIAMMAMGFKDGAEKYGAYNWRDKTVSASIYVGAALRHLMAWWDGEENAKDSGVHHLGHALACLGILVDGQQVDNLNDDRPTAGHVGDLFEDLQTKD